MPLNPMHSTFKECLQDRYGVNKQMVLTKLHLRKRRREKKESCVCFTMPILALTASMCTLPRSACCIHTLQYSAHTHISLESKLMLNGERFLSLFHYQSSKSRRKSRGDTEGEEGQQETKMDKTRY